MKLSRLVVITVAVVMAAFPVLCSAQSERGTVTGVVTDESKAAVPGVTVKITNTATGVVTNLLTSDSGAYTAPNLSPGSYKVEASLEGFKTTTIAGIVLTAS